MVWQSCCTRSLSVNDQPIGCQYSPIYYGHISVAYRRVQNFSCVAVTALKADTTADVNIRARFWEPRYKNERELQTNFYEFHKRWRVRCWGVQTFIIEHAIFNFINRIFNEVSYVGEYQDYNNERDIYLFLNI